MIKYLSLEGLQALVTKCKSYFVPQTRTVNSKALSSDIVIDGSDISVTVDNASEVLDTALANINSSLSSKADLVDGKIPSSQLPSYVDDVIQFYNSKAFDDTIEINDTEYTNAATFVYYNTTTNKFVGANIGLPAVAKFYSKWVDGTLNEASSQYGTETSTGVTPTKGKIYVETFTGKLYRWTGSTLVEISSCDLTTAEKSWIEKQLFDSLFTCTITASPSSGVYPDNTSVGYTLTTKYDGTLVDLDSVPSGWDKTGTGTYVAYYDVTDTTGSSISSGSVTCTYNGSSKTASAASYTNIKYSYIYYSAAESLTEFPETGLTQLSTSNNISGDKTLTIDADGKYVYFIIANTSILNNVQQLGLNYLQDDGGTALTREGYGTYTVYRSANAMSQGTQTVTIS